MLRSLARNTLQTAGLAAGTAYPVIAGLVQQMGEDEPSDYPHEAA